MREYMTPEFIKEKENNPETKGVLLSTAGRLRPPLRDHIEEILIENGAQRVCPKR